MNIIKDSIYWRAALETKPIKTLHLFYYKSRLNYNTGGFTVRLQFREEKKNIYCVLNFFNHLKTS